MFGIIESVLYLSLPFFPYLFSLFSHFVCARELCKRDYPALCSDGLHIWDISNTYALAKASYY